MGARQIRRGGGHIAPVLWLAIAAILLRIAIPAGWMPAADGAGLVPCLGVSAHAMHHGKGKPANEAPEHPCAFAGFAAALIAPDEIGGALPPPAAAMSSAIAIVAAVAVGRGLAAPPPPPTGPPALR